MSHDIYQGLFVGFKATPYSDCVYTKSTLHGHCHETATESWRPNLVQHMGVSKNRVGPPKWMVYNGNPYKNGWFRGAHPYFRKHPHIAIHISILEYVVFRWFCYVVWYHAVSVLGARLLEDLSLHRKASVLAAYKKMLDIVSAPNYDAWNIMSLSKPQWDYPPQKLTTWILYPKLLWKWWLLLNMAILMAFFVEISIFGIYQ